MIHLGLKSIPQCRRQRTLRTAYLKTVWNSPTCMINNYWQTKTRQSRKQTAKSVSQNNNWEIIQIFALRQSVTMTSSWRLLCLVSTEQFDQFQERDEGRLTGSKKLDEQQRNPPWPWCTARGSKWQIEMCLCLWSNLATERQPLCNLHICIFRWITEMLPLHFVSWYFS